MRKLKWKYHAAPLVLCCFMSLHAHAQTTARTYDGAVTVKRDRGTGVGAVAQQGAQPPLVLVNAEKADATDWSDGAPGADRTVSVKGVNSGVSQTLNVSPNAGEGDVLRGVAGNPALAVRTGSVTRWIAIAEPCPAYHSGSVNYEREERQTVTSGWTPTGQRRNHENKCVAETRTQWVDRIENCAAGYNGIQRYEAEQTSIGGAPWVDTGNKRNDRSNCVAIVEYRNIQLPPEPCPFEFEGPGIVRTVQEKRVGNGPWERTGVESTSNSCVGRQFTRTLEEFEQCPANYEGGPLVFHTHQQRYSGQTEWETVSPRAQVSGYCVGTRQERWVGKTASCAPGETGSINYEARQVRHGNAEWVEDGNVRNWVSTCTAPRLTFQEAERCWSQNQWGGASTLYCTPQSGDVYAQYDALMRNTNMVPPAGRMCYAQDYIVGTTHQCSERAVSRSVTSTCGRAGQEFYWGAHEVRLNEWQGTQADWGMDESYELIKYVCR